MPTRLLQFTIAMIGMFAFLQVYSVQAILPILMQDFALSEVQAGLLVGATVLGIAIMSPFMGMWSDKVGRKAVIVGSLLALAIPTGLMAITTNAHLMMGLRFMQGLAVPGITVVTIAYVGEEYASSALTKLMALYVSGTVLGGFLGRFILGHLHEWIGWRNAFWLMGITTLLGGLWVAKMLPASKQFEASPSFKAGLAVLKSHTSNPYLLSACLLGASVLFTLVGCFTFINLHLANAPYQLSTGQLANLFSVYLIGMLITPITSKLLHRLGSTRTVLLAVCISIFGMMITLSTPLWLIVVGLVFMCSGVFVTQSATISYIAMNVQQGRSLASGLYYMSYYAGGSLGAWACAFAYQVNGWQGVVALIGCVQGLALVVAGKLMVK